MSENAKKIIKKKIYQKNTSKKHASPFSKQKKYKDSEIAKIDDLINQRAEIKKQYSKSLAIPYYTALTNKEKVNVMRDMDKRSSNRFKRYSEIFEQIKQEITGINNSLSIRDNKKHTTNLRSMNFAIENQYSNLIKEEDKEDENIPIPTIIVNEPNKSDDRLLEENKKDLYITKSIIAGNDILLSHSRMKRKKKVLMPIAEQNSSIITNSPKKEDNKKIVYKKYFYPTENNELITQNNDEALMYHKNKSDDCYQYCNCLIN